MNRFLCRIALIASLALAATVPACAQAPATAADPLAPLDFLLGTWIAATQPAATQPAATQPAATQPAATGATGSSGGQVVGTYTFSRDLAGHAMQRTGTVATCKGPQDFDCNHHDQLTVFPDPNGTAVHGSSLFALYLDNEGHVIYYTLVIPDGHTVVFNSVGPPTAPKFRLSYHLEGSGPKAVMSGKFQMAAPGSDDYHSYLEWSGTKQ